MKHFYLLKSSFYLFKYSGNGMNGTPTSSIKDGYLISGDNKIAMTDDKVLTGFKWDNNGLPDNNANVHKVPRRACTPLSQGSSRSSERPTSSAA